ncbi:MAG: hypothetical protein IT250_15230 [Chitinophagaceae bacterium]|nr:hypothetical protein [Chitinophagaceae bacterium]
MEPLSETTRKYTRSTAGWKKYFFDLVAVTRPEGVGSQEVVLKFSPEVAPYVITKPIHPGQQQKNAPTGLTVRIKIIPNFELEKLMLPFGE